MTVFFRSRNGVGTIIELHGIVTGERPTAEDLYEYDIIFRNFDPAAFRPR